MANSVEDNPVARFANHILERSIARGAERIQFIRIPQSDWVRVKKVENGEERTEYEERPKPRGVRDRFEIRMEFDGTFEDVAMPPVALWEMTVARLKVLASIVDYGPYKSVDSSFTFTSAEHGSAEFYMTSNPNPLEDNEVMLVRKDGLNTKSEEYSELRERFLAAAMPSAEPGLEHTFGMFLEDLLQFYEERLNKKLSIEALIALRKASLAEMRDPSGDRRKFAEAMDLVGEHVKNENFAAAAEVIIDAYQKLYGSRRRRYEKILDSLADSDRAVVQAEFLEKVTLSIAPSRTDPPRQEIALAIDFPGEKTHRRERRWSLYLAGGRPMKSGNMYSYDGPGVSFSNFSTLGD
jgi:hypothetical protein